MCGILDSTVYGVFLCTKPGIMKGEQMKSLHIRLQDEHFEIFDELIKENQAKSYQELVIKLIDYTLRKKYGIDDVGYWPNYYKKPRRK